MIHSRRRFLSALATTGLGGLAGCLGGSSDNGTENPSNVSETLPEDFQIDLGVPCTETGGSIDLSGGTRPKEIEGARGSPETTYEAGEIPLRETQLYLGHDLKTLVENHLSGGVAHDGIPSIDQPKFVAGGDVTMPPCERVFGVAIDGDVRAYPQRILVGHEVVNDVVGGEPVAITYCPLTGTAQGFYRGGVTFGVSGQLVNSNLIMWDREFDVRWPQLAATAIEVGGERPTSRGERFVGRSLAEFRVIWTTWDRWSRKHPDTLVLSEDTGFARNYNRDPYGSYTPVSGHYALETNRRPKLPLVTAPEGQEKRVVIGARTSEGAIAFDKWSLLKESVLNGSIGSTPIVAVADKELATGYVYSNPTDAEVRGTDEGYAVDGVSGPPEKLPLDEILGFEAMWFAWHGYYPDTNRVGL
ncbi:DUF3179 domain-containing protein [Halodesulfurarchaeum sp.]|uniref:DUF3179 domain-containing protein n=1 Tax=Halodesulfurarchaeum sp. TaxID=1980530 RepID=UPI001BC5AEC0|nr:DUF3179 domain-containing protein [Halodesulfurarchaeum sp.]